MKQSVAVFAALFVALLFWSPPAAGLIMEPLSIETLAREADVVVRGRVLSQSCQRDESGRIYTEIQLLIGEVWKGQVAANPLKLVQAGGVLGDEKVVVAGQPAFTIGEEVVAFLVFNARGEAVTLGLGQGKFEVQTDPTTGEKQVRSIFHGSALKKAGSRFELDGNEDQANRSNPLAIDELKRQVREAKR